MLGWLHMRGRLDMGRLLNMLRLLRVELLLFLRMERLLLLWMELLLRRMRGLLRVELLLRRVRDLFLRVVWLGRRDHLWHWGMRHLLLRMERRLHSAHRLSRMLLFNRRLGWLHPAHGLARVL
jgi:hypothetical protein